MDIHALTAELPVWFLFTYSLLELAAYGSPSVRKQEWLFPVSAFLLFVGVLGTIATFIIAGDAISLTTLGLYLVLMAAYIVRIFDQKGWSNHVVGMVRPFMRIWNIKKYFAHLVLDTWLLPVLAFFSALGLYITLLS